MALKRLSNALFSIFIITFMIVAFGSITYADSVNKYNGINGSHLSEKAIEKFLEDTYEVKLEYIDKNINDSHYELRYKLENNVITSVKLYNVSAKYGDNSWIIASDIENSILENEFNAHKNEFNIIDKWIGVPDKSSTIQILNGLNIALKDSLITNKNLSYMLEIKNDSYVLYDISKIKISVQQNTDIGSLFGSCFLFRDGQYVEKIVY